MIEDKKTMIEFGQMFDGLSEYYQKDKLSKMALRLYWEPLKRYEFSQITAAITAHTLNPDGGQYYPKVSDLIGYIEGVRPSASEVIAMARLKNCPFGIIARIIIGTHDLKAGDHFYLVDRANEVLAQYDEIKARSFRGEYSDHEISIMLKHNINPASPFMPNISAPSEQVQKAIAHRAEIIKSTPRHLELIYVEPEIKNDNKAGIHPDVKSKLALILNK